MLVLLAALCLAVLIFGLDRVFAVVAGGVVMTAIGAVMILVGLCV